MPFTGNGASTADLVTSERGVCGGPLAFNSVTFVSHIAFWQSLACARSPCQSSTADLPNIKYWSVQSPAWKVALPAAGGDDLGEAGAGCRPIARQLANHSTPE
jgi:hypothetical protein